MLQGEGLVETRANGRMVTVRFGPDDLDDLLARAARARVVRGAPRHGARAATSSRCAPRFEAFRQEGATTERLVELDIAFHRALVEFGGSRFLTSAWLALAPVLQAVITIGNRRLAKQDPATHYRRILAAHEPMLEPLARRDAEPVVAIMAEQFALTRSQFFPARRAVTACSPGSTVILTGAAGGIGRHVARGARAARARGSG